MPGTRSSGRRRTRSRSSRLDLDPANGDKTAALKFEQTFPDAPKVTDPADLKDVLLAAAFDQNNANSDQPVDYATEIKPWLGSSAALAVFTDAQQRTEGIAILQVTDAAKAKTELAKLASDNPDNNISGYAVEGDYAVIGDTQAIVDAAVASARNSDIDANATYAADVATLKGAQLVTGWADLKALSSIGERPEDRSGEGHAAPARSRANSLCRGQGPRRSSDCGSNPPPPSLRVGCSDRTSARSRTAAPAACSVSCPADQSAGSRFRA